VILYIPWKLCGTFHPPSPGKLTTDVHEDALDSPWMSKFQGSGELARALLPVC
jgi:hypothetical protein